MCQDRPVHNVNNLINSNAQYIICIYITNIYKKNRFFKQCRGHTIKNLVLGVGINLKHTFGKYSKGLLNLGLEKSTYLLQVTIGQ